jgi:hypothetical protein
VEAYTFICCLLIAEPADQKQVSQDASRTLMGLFLDIWQDTKLPFRVEATKEQGSLVQVIAFSVTQFYIVFLYVHISLTFTNVVVITINAFLHVRVKLF